MYAITEIKAITCKETIAEKRKKKIPISQLHKKSKKKKRKKER